MTTNPTTTASPPAARRAARQPYDVYGRLEDPVSGFIHRLDGHVDVLDGALTLWADRDDSIPQPEVRRAANTAMDAIDLMLRELHAMRARLVSEIRTADDAAAARVDAMLAASQAAADVTDADGAQS